MMNVVTYCVLPSVCHFSSTMGLSVDEMRNKRDIKATCVCHWIIVINACAIQVLLWVSVISSKWQAETRWPVIVGTLQVLYQCLSSRRMFWQQLGGHSPLIVFVACPDTNQGYFWIVHMYINTKFVYLHSFIHACTLGFNIVSIY